MAHTVDVSMEEIHLPKERKIECVPVCLFSIYVSSAHHVQTFSLFTQVIALTLSFKNALSLSGAWCCSVESRMDCNETDTSVWTELTSEQYWAF